MKRRSHISAECLIFSKWKRKNYAIFATLNRVVIIAHLSIDTCVCLFSKLKQLQCVELGDGDATESEKEGLENSESHLLKSLVYRLGIEKDFAFVSDYYKLFEYRIMNKSPLSA